MHKRPLSFLLVTLLAVLVPNFAEIALAQTTQGAESSASKPAEVVTNAPTQHTVVKGDTLWSISATFLKEPWRWPEVWNMNREQIKNPHLIYPGDVIYLTYDANGKPQLSVGQVPQNGSPGESAQKAAVAEEGLIEHKVQPRVRESVGLAGAIPSIPARVVAPFVTFPLVLDESSATKAAKIVSTEDERVIVGAGDRIYATGISASEGTRWQIYRPNKVLKDPISAESLGVEVIRLGDAKVLQQGEVSKLEILKSEQEINKGDRLIPAKDVVLPPYVPRAPGQLVKGAIVSVYGGVNESTQYSVVAINLGKKQGIEVGHVLAGFKAGNVVNANPERSSALSSLPKVFTGNDENAKVKLPDERSGLLFVFQVFDKISYALVMSGSRILKVGDTVKTP